MVVMYLPKTPYALCTPYVCVYVWFRPPLQQPIRNMRGRHTACRGRPSEGLPVTRARGVLPVMELTIM